MNRADVVVGLGLSWALSALALGCAAAQATEGPSKPNVIVIFTDDHGFADLGAQGVRDDVKTPHLDRLAAGGVRMTHGYVTAPQCVPSRAGLLTGRYQTRFNLETNHDGPLLHGEVTIAERLKRAGYITGMCGKWHLNPNRQSKNTPPGAKPLDFMPHRQGFDEYLCGPRRRYLASHDAKGNKLDKPAMVEDRRFRIDVQSDWAVNFIDRHAGGDEPFLLYVSYFAPHVPLEATDRYLARFPGEMPHERRLALAMLAAIDDGVGRITEKLEEHGVERNTLVFFISDNGAPLKQGAWDGSLNEPLVGEKGMLTDGGVRVPFLVSWPGVLPAGEVYEKPVISLDVAATANALAGLPHDEALDGVNLVPHLRSEAEVPPHDRLYWRWRSQAAVRQGRWKLIMLGEHHRLLFDLASPQHEHANVIADHPEVAAELEAHLKRWAAAQNPAGLPTGKLHPEGSKFFRAHLTRP